VIVPEDLAAALAGAGLRGTFDGLAFTHRREYVEWIEDARRQETRRRRLEQAVERLAAGEKEPR
jgi:uncharacterized protein YdeI (YjbR/CyaY-like superfamily)